MLQIKIFSSSSIFKSPIFLAHHNLKTVSHNSGKDRVCLLLSYSEIGKYFDNFSLPFYGSNSYH